MLRATIQVLGRFARIWALDPVKRNVPCSPHDRFLLGVGLPVALADTYLAGRQTSIAGRPISLTSSAERAPGCEPLEPRAALEPVRMLEEPPPGAPWSPRSDRGGECSVQRTSGRMVPRSRLILKLCPCWIANVRNCDRRRDRTHLRASHNPLRTPIPTHSPHRLVACSELRSVRPERETSSRHPPGQSPRASNSRFDASIDFTEVGKPNMASYVGVSGRVG